MTTLDGHLFVLRPNLDFWQLQETGLRHSGGLREQLSWVEKDKCLFLYNVKNVKKCVKARQNHAVYLFLLKVIFHHWQSTLNVYHVPEQILMKM